MQKPGPDAYPLFLKLEFTKLIEKFGLTPGQTEAAERADVTVTVEQVTSPIRRSVCWNSGGRRTTCPCCPAGPDRRDGGLGDRGGHSWLRGAVFQQISGDWNALLGALFSADIKKVSHNVKDLMRALLENGLPAEGFIFDTALAAYLLDATAGSYDLQRLFVSYYNTELMKPLYLEPDAFSPLGDTLQAETAFHCHTSAVDALYGTLAPKLREKQLWDLYETAELPLCRVLAEMETAGCRVDKGALVAFGEMLSATSPPGRRPSTTWPGRSSTSTPPKQLGEILFGKLGLPHGQKDENPAGPPTPTCWRSSGTRPHRGGGAGVPPVRQAEVHLRRRAAEGHDPDGRVRTSFQMTVTATGRLSSAEPTSRTSPPRTDLGSEIRRMFIPADGCVLVDADYSQIELRLLAHISGDRDMQAAFLSGGDFHAETAAKVFRVDPADVTHEMRRQAKAVNFGIVYGISAFSLSQDIGVSVAEAKAYMEAYFATFPGVRTYMDDIVERAREQGYVETLFHRRRDLPELKSSNFNLRSFGERVALNMPIQGTAADIMKLAMVAVWKRLRAELPEPGWLLRSTTN